MMDLESFLFGFWTGACVIICIWGIQISSNQRRKNNRKQDRRRDF